MIQTQTDFDTEHRFKHPSPRILEGMNLMLQMSPNLRWLLMHTSNGMSSTTHYSDYTYLVEHHQELPKASFSGVPKVCFQAHLRVNLQNGEQIKHWLHALQSHSKCMYRYTDIQAITKTCQAQGWHALSAFSEETNRLTSSKVFQTKTPQSCVQHEKK